MNALTRGEVDNDHFCGTTNNLTDRRARPSRCGYDLVVVYERRRRAEGIVSQLSSADVCAPRNSSQ